MKINKYIPILIFSYAIALKPFIIKDGINTLLLLIIIIYNIYYIKYIIKIRKGSFSIIYLALYLLFKILIDKNYRYESFFYSILFIANYKAYYEIINKKGISLVLIKKTYSIIIFLYFIVGIIQYCLFQIGISFNQIWASTNRINSLATEPSYTGIIIIITFYSYLKISKYEKGNIYKYKILINWIFVITVVILSKSSYAIVFLILLIVNRLFNNLKNKYFNIIIIIVILIITTSFIINNSNYEPISRIKKLLSAAITLDISNMAESEHSGSIRIAPLIVFINNIKYRDISFIIGYGTGYSSNLMVNNIPGINILEWRGGGFIPQAIIDNGILYFLLFIRYLRKCVIGKLFTMEALFLLLIFLNVNFNTQLFWYSIIIFTTNRYFKNQTAKQT